MNWTEKNNSLEKEFTFKDFKQAFGFLQQVAFIAEKANHHPTIINTYNKVVLQLNTHDAGNTVTTKDHELAKKIDKILSEN
jgi:4a-hydroxytetrahydrobiopterin dehydratase